MSHAVPKEQTTSVRQPLPFRPRPAERPNRVTPRSSSEDQTVSNIIAFPGPDWRQPSSRHFGMQVAAVVAAVVLIEILVVLIYSGTL